MDTIRSSGITIPELAQLAGLSDACVYRILTEGTANVYSIDAIACALGTHYTAFIEGKS